MRRTAKWIFVSAAGLSIATAITGCELIVDFDRSKIPQGGLLDGTIEDAPAGDTASPDGPVGDAGGGDASSVADGGPADGSAGDGSDAGAALDADAAADGAGAADARPTRALTRHRRRLSMPPTRLRSSTAQAQATERMHLARDRCARRRRISATDATGGDDAADARPAPTTRVRRTRPTPASPEAGALVA